MIDLIIFGVAAVLVLGLFTYTFVTNKKKSKDEVEVKFDKDDVIICWKGHTATFEFYTDCEDEVTYYTGTTCEESYSSSVTSNSKDKKLPWILWAECNGDEVKIKTDLKGRYEII